MERIYCHNHVEVFSVHPGIFFRKSDYFLRRQCNSVYLVGRDSVGVVDLPTMEASEEMAAEAEQLFHKPIRHVFLTHGHGDHTGGLPAFMDCDVTVFCSGSLLQELSPPADSRAVFVSVEGKSRIRFGELEIELFTLPEKSHSPWDLFIRIPSAGLIISGDNAVEKRCFYCCDSDIYTWPGVLRRLASLGDRQILPGHGGIVPIDYFNDMADYVETVVRAGQIFLSKFSDDKATLSDPEKLAQAAGRFICSELPETQTMLRKAGESAATDQTVHIAAKLISAQQH